MIAEFFFSYFNLDSLKKALVPHGTSRQLTEAAAVTAVKLCKVSTYIHFLDSGNVVFALVQSMLNDLKVFDTLN
jgi:neurofibromin 1